MQVIGLLKDCRTLVSLPQLITKKPKDYQTIFIESNLSFKRLDYTRLENPKVLPKLFLRIIQQRPRCGVRAAEVFVQSDGLDMHISFWVDDNFPLPAPSHTGGPRTAKSLVASTSLPRFATASASKSSELKFILPRDTIISVVRLFWNLAVIVIRRGVASTTIHAAE